VTVRSDSQLLVRQFLGEYKVRDAKLRPLHDEARRLARAFDSFEIVHIPREQNRAADRLANRARLAQS
jgi:ribonuclease HI